MVIDTENAVSQAEFGRIIGVSQQAVSKMLVAGVLDEGGALGDWLLAAFGHLREQAAGRQTSTPGLSLADERAQHARVKRQREMMRLSAELGEWAPMGTLTEALAKATAQIATVLEGIPASLQCNHPDLTPKQLDEIRATINQARNIAAAASIDAAMDAIGAKLAYLAEFESIEPEPSQAQENG